MNRIILLLLTSILISSAQAQGWATFRNCATTADPRPEQPAGDGCAQAEIPEDLESGTPDYVCRSTLSPSMPDLIARIYSSRSGHRAYIYADGLYQKTVLTFPGVACLLGDDGLKNFDVSEFIYNRNRQTPALIELNCNAGEIELFRIQR